jgi:hypothetical protein
VSFWKEFTNQNSAGLGAVCNLPSDFWGEGRANREQLTEG